MVCQNLITPTGIVGTFYGSTSTKCIDNSGLSAIPTTVAGAAAVTHISPASISDATYLNNGSATTAPWNFTFSTPQNIQGFVAWQPCSPHNGGDAPFNKILITTNTCNTTFYDTLVMGLPSPNAKFKYFSFPKFGITSITLNVLESWVYNNLSTGSCNSSIGWTSASSSSVSNSYNVMLGEIKFIEATSTNNGSGLVEFYVSNNDACLGCDSLTFNIVNNANNNVFGTFTINSCPDTISLCIDTLTSYDIVAANNSVTFSNAIVNGQVNYPGSQNVFEFSTSTICCPDVSFGFSNNSGCVNSIINFYDSTNTFGNPITSLIWYFGDGDSLVGIQNPTHTYLSSGVYQVTLVVTNNSNCTDSFTLPITIYPTYSNSVNLEICQGDSIFIGGAYQNVGGVYTDSLQTINSCDSILVTNLVVNTSYLMAQSQQICQGDSVLFANNYYSSTGIFYDSLQTSLGCDSVFELNLQVQPNIQNSQTVNICQGDSVLIHGNYQNTSGIYSDTSQSALGCDSISITTLIVDTNYNHSNNVEICQGDSIFIGGAYQSVGGTYIDSLQTSNGCDSIVTSNLIVYPTYLYNQNQQICQGDSFLFANNYYTSSGVYYDSLRSVFGCDSINSLNLQVTPIYQLNQTIDICQGDSILLQNNYQTTTGIYVDSFQTIYGCDSLIITSLVVHSNYLDSLTIEICQGDSIFIEGTYQTASGTYLDSLSSYKGCDSIVAVNLIVHPLPVVKAFKDTTINSGMIVQLTASGAYSYLWSPNYNLSCINCQSPTAFPKLTTTYIVKGTLNNCSSYDTITIIVETPEFTLYVPNSFTPDYDKANDVFYFYGTGIEEFEALIFNRWGELLCKITDINDGWDGTYKGKEVPIGVYVYKVQARTITNRNISKIGSINLIR